MKLQQKLILSLFVLATTVYAVLGASLFNGFYRFVSDREQVGLETAARLCARLVEAATTQRIDLRESCGSKSAEDVAFRLYSATGELVADGFPWDGVAFDITSEESGTYRFGYFQKFKTSAVPVSTANGSHFRLVAATRAVNWFTLLIQQKGIVAVNSVIAFLFVVLLAVIFSQVVTRPLKVLQLFVAKRKLSSVARPPDFAPDEIGDLGREFCGLIDELEGKAHFERYVRTLTHELKSPITGIRSASEILQQDLDTSERQTFAKQIEFEAARMQATVDRLQQLASLEGRPRAREFHSVDLTALGEDVVILLGAQAKGKDLGLSLESPEEPTPVFVNGDAELLRSALLAMVENALAFTSAGGAISLEIATEAQSARVVVTDSGVGIPPFAVDKVFDRFFSLPRPDTGQKSSGLGLSYCLEIARLHNGRVEVGNRQPPERGVQATLTIPLALSSQRTHTDSR